MDFSLIANSEHLRLCPGYLRGLTVFWRQEGHWCWFCGTPYLPFDLVPSCEGPAGDITSATLKLGRMTNG